MTIRFFSLTFSQRCGAALLGLLLLFSLGVPLLTDLTPYKQDLFNTLATPTWSQPFGTDHLGRSMIARIAAAIRLSLGLAILSVMTAAVIGVIFGVIAGLFGGWCDRLLTLLAEIFGSIPSLLLMLLVSAIFGGSYLGLYLAISCVMWLEYYQTTRAIVKSLTNSTELQASRLLGFGYAYCFWQHLWPRLKPMLLHLCIFSCANTILVLATLGFVSVGLKPPTAELGLMMTELFVVFYEAPWVLLQPIAALFLTIVSLQLLLGEQQ